jgi:Mg-chelatase subunit ChlI
MEFETANPASNRLQTQASDRVATEIRIELLSTKLTLEGEE